MEINIEEVKKTALSVLEDCDLGLITISNLINEVENRLDVVGSLVIHRKLFKQWVIDFSESKIDNDENKISQNKGDDDRMKTGNLHRVQQLKKLAFAAGLGPAIFRSLSHTSIENYAEELSYILKKKGLDYSSTPTEKDIGQAREAYRLKKELDDIDPSLILSETKRSKRNVQSLYQNNENVCNASTLLSSQAEEEATLKQPKEAVSDEEFEADL